MIVTMEEMSVKDHLIFYVEHQMFGMTVRIAKLMGEGPFPSPAPASCLRF